MSWLVVLLTSVLMGLIFTRVARHAATRLGLLDEPDGVRKTHPHPMPLAGGLAVLAATLLTLLVAPLVFPNIASAFRSEARHGLALLTAACVIVAVGLLDDIFRLRPRDKLLGQFAAITVLLVFGGLWIERLSLLGHIVELGPLAIPFTVCWLLACVNALNLIDGMDGLLGTVGMIALLSLAVIAIMLGQTFPAVVALALAGSVGGFLWFNLPPASVYMGDSGSMLIGLVIGALAIPASLKGPAVIALGSPVALLVLPMMDATAAVVRRKLTGRAVTRADRGHLHHVLQRHGFTTRGVLLLVAVFGLLTSGGALATTALQNDLFALVAAGSVVVSLVSTRLFGYAEWMLIRQRLTLALRTVVRAFLRRNAFDNAEYGVRSSELLTDPMSNVRRKAESSELALAPAPCGEKSDFRTTPHRGEKSARHGF